MKLGAYAGIATPIVWFALLITAGALAPGYDPIRQYMTNSGRGQDRLWAADLIAAPRRSPPRLVRDPAREAGSDGIRVHRRNERPRVVAVRHRSLTRPAAHGVGVLASADYLNAAPYPHSQSTDNRGDAMLLIGVWLTLRDQCAAPELLRLLEAAELEPIRRGAG